MNEKFGLLKGLSDIYICEIEDTEDSYTMVGTPEQLIPAGELSNTKSFEKTPYYFDNTLWEESGRETPSELSITGAAVRAAFLAWLEGKDIDTTTGAILDDGVWHRKYFAISGKKDYTDGSSDYFWFLKCTYGGAEETAQTKNDTPDASGMTLPFTAYTTIHKFGEGATARSRKVVRIDTTKTEINSEASWTAQVVTPDNLSTICTKKATE